MLKIAFQLGLQYALEEAGNDELLAKEAAGKGALEALRSAGRWALKNKKYSIPAALAGAGALGTGAYLGGKHLLKKDEPGFLESAGELANGLTSDPQLMQSLLGMAVGGMGGAPQGALGLDAGGMGGAPQGALGLAAGGDTFPPDPSYGVQMGAVPVDPYATQQGYGAHQPLQY